MLLIPCPHCGPCAQIEFSYGGDASIVQANMHTDAGRTQDSQSTQQWLDSIYLRDNPRGPHLEWWQHNHGCRAWIKVRRNTATHEILGAWQASQSVPSAVSALQSGDEADA